MHGRWLGVGVALAAGAVALGLLTAASAPAGLSGAVNYNFVDKPIPDGKGARVVRFNYDGTASVNDVNAQLRVNHARTRDLVVSLKHARVSVKLSDHDTTGRQLGTERCKRQPQSSTDFPNFTTFNDESDTAIADGTPPYDDFDGYDPRKPLTAFDGVRLGGQWRLVVRDTRGGNEGVLKCARLVIGNSP